MFIINSLEDAEQDIEAVEEVETIRVRFRILNFCKHWA